MLQRWMCVTDVHLKRKHKNRSKQRCHPESMTDGRISKILEKVVYKQLMSFLEEHGILEVFQSGC